MSPHICGARTSELPTRPLPAGWLAVTRTTALNRPLTSRIALSTELVDAAEGRWALRQACNHLSGGACPKLRGRPEGALSALCIPVSIMGRSIGVIHATGDRYRSFADDTVRDLETLAKLSGARIGMLRVMSETQLQAMTDSLTGLLNRRSFEDKASALRRKESLIAVAMADLDHFKLLNDTYGHDTGDRAPRLFAQVLTESVRGDDLVCRQGGEEFVVALPGCTTERAREILEALRTSLGAAITVAGLPRFTVSFGVVEAADQEDLPATIARADAALFEAKEGGRDQVVVHDESGNTVRSRLDHATVLVHDGEHDDFLGIPVAI
jgi:diguanylate cyclase (GGDEF)-like protein